MKDDPAPPPVSSSSWTGVPEGMRGDPPGWQHAGPPPRWPREEALMASLLFFLGILLYAGWWIVLSFHSPTSPHPATGHTAPLSLARGGGTGIYVREYESLIALAILLSVFVMPGAYLAWRGFRRHPPR